MVIKKRELISYEQAEKTFFDLFPDIVLMGVLQEPENMKLLLWSQISVTTDKESGVSKTQEEWDELFRLVVLETLDISNQLNFLLERMNFTEVGFTGHVSIPDKSIAQERKLEPLNDFERFLLKTIIDSERKFRRDCFRQAVLEVTGE